MTTQDVLTLVAPLFADPDVTAVEIYGSTSDSATYTITREMVAQRVVPELTAAERLQALLVAHAQRCGCDGLACNYAHAVMADWLERAGVR